MWSEISCWYWDWNAIGSVATGAAASVAFAGWWGSRVAAKKRVTNQIQVTQHLLVAELVRVSACAAGLRQIFQKPYQDMSDESVIKTVLSKLDISRTAMLVELCGELPLDLGVASAKFIAVVEILDGSIQMAVDEVRLRMKRYPDLPAYPPSQAAKNAIVKYSSDALAQAMELAKLLEAASKAPARSIQQQIELTVSEGEAATR